jgi:hypothetical protein
MRKIFEDNFSTKGEFHFNSNCNLQIYKYSDEIGPGYVAFAQENFGPEAASIVNPCRDLFLESRQKCDIEFEKFVWIAPPPRLRIFSARTKHSTWFEVISFDGSPHRSTKRSKGKI